MPTFSGNLLVAQSGGPTSVVNASAAGVIEEAGKHPDEIPEIFAGQGGIHGVLQEDLFDLNEEKSSSVRDLRHIPAAALGTCRYKINFEKDPQGAERDMDRLFQVFEAHNIRYFFYIGGNDSQDTSHKIHQQAIARGYPLRVIGIPKTIDNDLPHTDHCPGYGSAIKYNAATVQEIGLDVGSMHTEKGACCVIEVMGRSAGWIAAGTVLARRRDSDPPHIVLLPEIPFDEDAFLKEAERIVEQERYCVVVAGEGLRDQAGQEMGADRTRLDSFGHPVLAGVGERLAEIIRGRIGLKTRTVKLGYAQRAAAHYASRTDVEEAYQCGVRAVQAAVLEGRTGCMVKLVRVEGAPDYQCGTDLHPLEEVANVERRIPREWIDQGGFVPNRHFVDYARPLIQGRNEVPEEGGLPHFVRLARIRVDRRLDPYVF